MLNFTLGKNYVRIVFTKKSRTRGLCSYPKNMTWSRHAKAGYIGYSKAAR